MASASRKQSVVVAREERMKEGGGEREKMEGRVKRLERGVVERMKKPPTNILDWEIWFWFRDEDVFGFGLMGCGFGRFGLEWWRQGDLWDGMIYLVLE